METPIPQPRISRPFLREPIGQIAQAAQHLDEAVSAHLNGNSSLAEELIRRADMPEVREWCESLWGKDSRYVQYVPVVDAPSSIAKELRKKPRMPLTSTKSALLLRDGYRCRFCGIPVIRSEVRRRIVKSYPKLEIWGRTNQSQHAAFQTMWAPR
jgi:hypothetical protein